MLQEPVTFEEVSTQFSGEQWQCLDPDQQALSRDMMLDNFGSSASLGKGCAVGLQSLSGLWLALGLRGEAKRTATTSSCPVCHKGAILGQLWPRAFLHAPLQAAPSPSLNRKLCSPMWFQVTHPPGHKRPSDQVPETLPILGIHTVRYLPSSPHMSVSSHLRKDL